ncbi:MAG: hypothetical protein K2Y32_11175 [Candidatus Obscuribacterales bacterium]|nr:hypothetical protein [Candidatus Obscuribacterales bacterium]
MTQEMFGSAGINSKEQTGNELNSALQQQTAQVKQNSTTAQTYFAAPNPSFQSLTSDSAIFKTDEPRANDIILRRQNREKEAAKLRESARHKMLAQLKDMPLPEHIALALEATIYEITDKAPRAEYLAEILVLFLPEEKLVFTQMLGLLLKGTAVKVGYWRGEVLFSLHDQAGLQVEVKINAANKVLMTSRYEDLEAPSCRNNKADAATRTESGQSLVDHTAFITICAKIWTSL